MPEVLFRSGTGNKDIINVCVGERKTTENLVHESLKGLCCIPQAERHSHELKQTERCCDGGFWYIFGGYRNLVVCTHEVQFREDGGTLPVMTRRSRGYGGPGNDREQ